MKSDKPEAGTPEFFATQLIANELMTRALFQMHPNKNQVEVYLDRMLGQVLTQPHYILNPGQSALLKEVLDRIRNPGPAETPEGP
jgi:hypothetical protein